jgi:hypothetical protein
MSDELKPQSIDTPEFHDFLLRYGIWRPDDVAVLVAHIDAWGARLAGDAAKDAERYRWLRDKCPDFEGMTSAWLYDSLDETIDKAIAAAKKDTPCGS